MACCAVRFARGSSGLPPSSGDAPAAWAWPVPASAQAASASVAAPVTTVVIVLRIVSLLAVVGKNLHARRRPLRRL